MAVYFGDILTEKSRLSSLLLPAGKFNVFFPHSRGQRSNQQERNIPTTPPPPTLQSVLSATLCFDCTGVLSQCQCTTNWNFPADTSRLADEHLYPGETNSHPNSQTHTVKINCLVCKSFTVVKFHPLHVIERIALVQYKQRIVIMRLKHYLLH